MQACADTEMACVAASCREQSLHISEEHESSYGISHDVDGLSWQACKACVGLGDVSFGLSQPGHEGSGAVGAGSDPRSLSQCAGRKPFGRIRLPFDDENLTRSTATATLMYT
eukprot:69314-Chlamydomonas_euryale.AAC.2